MKKYFIIAALLFATAVFAQPGKKQAVKAKPSSQKGMAAMMKELQKEMADVDPGDKEMLDSTGLKMPDVLTRPKNKGGVSDAALQKAFEDDSRIVPLKDAGRIAAISKIPLSDAAIPGFLQTVHAQLTGWLEPYIQESGEKIYQWLKKEYNTPTATGNAAVGLWMMGKPTVALYILSKACKDDPADADNLNNFSAILTMSGAEQLALPLLNNLNKKFPGNSTLLNNIGQAWFGLGDIDKAEKYFDSTIRIYAHHAQANLTQSRIEESKGNNAQAVEAVMNSIAEAYSMEKADRLEELGHKLQGKDLRWDQPMPKDALGLERFRWPDYPVSVERSGPLEKEWDAFIASCQKEIDGLKEQEESLEKIAGDASLERNKEVLQGHGSMVDPVPFFAHKAYVKLAYLVDGKDGQLARTMQRKTDALAEAGRYMEVLDMNLAKRIAEIDEKYKNEFGEGKRNPFQARCADLNEAHNAFLNQANTLIETTYTDYANFIRRKLNDQAYYDQYTKWPEDFELSKVRIKLDWLNTIKGQKPYFLQKCESGVAEQDTAKHSNKLAQFDDMHCNYHSESQLIVGTITSDCGQLTAKFDLYLLKNTLGIEVVKLGIKMKQGDSDDESFWDQFQTASVELGVKKGIGTGAGPLRVEAKAGIAGRVEIGKHGVTDVAIIATGDVKIGTNIIKVLEGTTTIVDNSEGPVKDKSMTIVGVEAKLSLVSGFTAEAKSFLKGLKK
jgi:tetratricopeptide (TPR) repeat protein